MNARSIMTIAAMLTITAPGCASTAGQGNLAPGEANTRSSLASPRSPPTRRIEERYRDNKGVELVLSRDATGKVSAKASGPDGKAVDVNEVQLENRVLVCQPKPGTSEVAKDDCQLLNFMSEGTIIKLGTTSCTCIGCGDTAFCYGSPCPHR